MKFKHTILSLCIATAALGGSVTVANAACVIGVRSNDVLNMRSYASTRAAIVGAIGPNRCGITIRKRSGNWGLIRYRGRQGWVNLRYVGEGDEGDGDHVSKGCVRGVASNDVLNIRSRPSGSSRIKGIIPPGRCGVEIYNGQGNWYAISYRGVSGWVSKRYIRRR